MHILFYYGWFKIDYILIHEIGYNQFQNMETLSIQFLTTDEARCHQDTYEDPKYLRS